MMMGLKPRFHADIGRPSLMASTADAGLMADIAIERDPSSPQGTVKPEAGLQRIAHPPDQEGITFNDPIPMTITRIANIERAQLLIECASRPALQAFLKDWIRRLRKIKTRVRWSLEVDPVDI